MKLRSIIFAVPFLFLQEVSAATNELCVYADPSGSIKQVNSREDVPAQYRSSARCFSKSESPYLARPQEIELNGNTRRETMNSPVGRINLRWPRKVETLFGRTPMRAMTDAAQTVGKALRRGSVPSSIQNVNLEWQVVFLDAELPETQIPSYLISNCHPGWMTPPANVYIVGQRVAGGCGGPKVSTGVADAQLTEVLVHEMGHAIEYALLAGKSNPDERMRKEGFATWFESYAADSSSFLSRSELLQRMKAETKRSYETNPGFFFQGSSEDYSRAAAHFAAVEARRGVSGVFEIYRSVEKGQLLAPAIQQAIGWNQETLEQEIQKFAGVPAAQRAKR